MKRIAAAVLLLTAAPLLAQRSGGGRIGGAGPITRVAPPGGGFRVPGFLDPGVEERRPVIPMHIGPIPFPPVNIEWLRADTPHFVIISAVGEHGTRSLAHDLEKLTTLLTNTSDYFHAPAERTRVFLFAQRRNVQPYFDTIRGGRVDASGITLRHPKGTTVLIDTTARGGGSLTPRHEVVHDLLFREKALPLWVEEGLAEYYSNAGMSIREHITRLRGRLHIPLKQMFAIGASDSTAWTFDYYAQSWAAVATLMRRDAISFFAMLRDIDHGIDTTDALRARYNMSPRDLEIAIRRVGSPAASLLMHNGTPLEVTLKPVPRADLLYELGELLSRVQGREAEAERHFRAALEAGATSGAIHLAYAELLLAVRDREVDARVEAQTAIDHDRTLETRATGVIGLTYLAANDATTARSYLEKTYEIAPEQLEFSLPLFSIYLEDGDRTRADQLFARLAATPRANEARQRLLDADIPRADALARAGKLVEAAKILRELAPKMPEKARENLEGQAVRLESMAGGGRD
ncbi:MAG: hypothetical protein DMF56_17335 [Acidobacteria bacterium]|nr:MAG: hypothetical protein DMF56_17335 [Acidobacteriota bacterium]